MVGGILSVVLWALPIGFGGGQESPSLGAVLARSPPVEGELTMADVAKAVEGIRDLGNFFAKLAQNDPNRIAGRRWSTLYESYAGAARQLTDLLNQGRIRLDDLPEGTASAVDRGAIVIDRAVAGRWLPRFVRSARQTGGDWQYTSLLSTLLLQDLLRVAPESGQSWFGEHLARSTLAEIYPSEADPRLARHFAGLWHIKDKHFRLAMLGDATTDPGLRRLNEGRKIDLMSEARSSARGLERDLGSYWADMLWRDWQDYLSQIRSFSPRRSWLLASRRTTLESLPPEQLEVVPPAKPKPRALGGPTPTPAPEEADISRDTRVAELTAALEESRARATRREAQLFTELESLRRELETAETARAESDERVAELRNVLTVEREDSEARRAQLAAEQAARFEASAQLVSELREQLAAERAAGQEALAGLQAELAAEQQASRQQLARLEEDTAGRLEASAQLVSELREQLAAERAAGHGSRPVRNSCPSSANSWLWSARPARRRWPGCRPSWRPRAKPVARRSRRSRSSLPPSWRPAKKKSLLSGRS
jgi:hypothetical protein